MNKSPQLCHIAYGGPHSCDNKPPAGDWLAGAWAELGKNWDLDMQISA